jgi:deoxyribodipyrimidine photo-lyase
MRHFNIIKQGKDYDPDGEYIRLWCPELEHVPSLFIQAPWLMPSDVQKESKCVIGTDYPKPMYLVETWKNHYPAASKDIKSYFKEEKKDSKKHNK